MSSIYGNRNKIAYLCAKEFYSEDNALSVNALSKKYSIAQPIVSQACKVKRTIPEKFFETLCAGGSITRTFKTKKGVEKTSTSNSPITILSWYKPKPIIKSGDIPAIEEINNNYKSLGIVFRNISGHYLDCMEDIDDISIVDITDRVMESLSFLKCVFLGRKEIFPLFETFVRGNSNEDPEYVLEAFKKYLVKDNFEAVSYASDFLGQENSIFTEEDFYSERHKRMMDERNKNNKRGK